MAFGCCPCNACTETVTLPVVTNEAKVAGYPDTPTPPIAPYIRPDGADRPAECGLGYQPRCNAWPRDERPVVGDCTGTFQSWNCYVSADSTVVRTLDKKGEILVQSRKAFHGRKPFTFCPGPCATLPSKYLGVSVTCSVTLTPGGTADSGSGWASNYEGSFAVGRTSGVITGSGTASATVGTTSDWSEEDAKYFARVLAVTRTSCACRDVNEPHDLIDCNDEDAGDPEAIWDGALYTGLEEPPAVRFAHVMARLCIDALNGVYVYAPSGDISIATNSIGATVLELDVTWTPGVSSPYYFGGSSVRFYLKVELATEYTPALVQSDLLAATSLWVLANRKILPWGTHGYRALGPIVRYDEVPGAVDPDVAGFEGSIGLAEGMAPDGTFTDTNTQTGDLTGQPIEATFADADPVTSFDFDHIKYTDLTTSPVPTEYGAFSDGTIVPHSAGHWTNNLEAGATNRWPGSGYWFDEDEEVLHCQKHAEVKPKLDSFNFFSRAGYKRWLSDTGVYRDGTTAHTSWQVSGFDGDNPQVDGTIPGYGDITGYLTEGTLVVFTGGPNDGEIYYLGAGSSYDGGTQQTTIVLGAQLVTDATEWAALKTKVQAAHTTAKWTLDQGVHGRISFLRYQYDRSGTQWPSNRAIVGRVAVTATYDSGTDRTKFTLGAHHVITGDKIEVRSSDGTGYTALAGPLDVVATTATEVFVDGDHTTSAAFLVSWEEPDSPATDNAIPYYAWNDIASYGDFVTRTSESSVVDGVYTLTNAVADDSKTGDCAIISCSPDGDDPAGAKAVGFPSLPTFTICGGRKWKQFITYSVAPDWQDPVSVYDTFTGCPEYVEVRTGIRGGTRGGQACPALPDHCIFTAPTAPVEGAGYADILTPNVADGPWMSTCIYPP